MTGEKDGTWQKLSNQDNNKSVLFSTGQYEDKESNKLATYLRPPEWKHMYATQVNEV